MAGTFSGQAGSAKMSGKRTVSLRRTLATLAVVLLVSTGLPLGLLWLQGLPSARPYMAFASLKNIYQGLRYYDDLNGHLPPATSTDDRTGELCSWRIEVYQAAVNIGFIRRPRGNESVSIDYDRDEPWNGPANVRLEALGASIFQYTHRYARDSKDYSAYYKTITGPGTAFDPTKRRSLRELPDDLVLVARVEQSETHWMEPGDLCVGDLVESEDRRALLSGENGYAVLFADGTAWILSRELPFSELCKFFTIAGADRCTRENLLAPYRVLP